MTLSRVPNPGWKLKLRKLRKIRCLIVTVTQPCQEHFFLDATVGKKKGINKLHEEIFLRHKPLTWSKISWDSATVLKSRSTVTLWNVSTYFRTPSVPMTSFKRPATTNWWQITGENLVLFHWCLRRTGNAPSAASSRFVKPETRRLCLQNKITNGAIAKARSLSEFWGLWENSVKSDGGKKSQNSKSLKTLQLKLILILIEVFTWP